MTALPYPDTRTHTEDELTRVRRLFERAILIAWEQGALPRVKDEFSGTFVSGDEVKALLAGPRTLSDAGARSLAAIDDALAADDARIASRLQASRAAGSPLGWDLLCQRLALSSTERLALFTLAGVELDVGLRQLARYLMNDASRVHWDAGLVEACVYGAGAPAFFDELAADGRLLGMRLLESVGSRRHSEEAPFLLRPLRVSPRVLDLIGGRVRLDREVARVATLVEETHVGERVGGREVVEQVHGLIAHARSHANTRALVLVGPEGAGKRALIAAAGARLEVRALSLPVEPDELARLGRAIAREALLLDAIPVLVELDAMPPESAAARIAALDDGLSALSGPLVVTLASREPRMPLLARGTVRIDVPPPTEAERAELWRRSLVEGSVVTGFNVERVAGRYPITGGVIARAAGAARTLALARGDGSLRESDVHDGLRSVLDNKMSALGTRVTRRQAWDDLVLPEETLEAIFEFMARLRYRRQVYEDWGFARKLAKGLGVSALFSGPPGTGKTMVAGLIADELGLDLYQIDLSRIVSKYIGETEKNLSQLFDAAEAGHAILLFDEADSLFAKRSEVKSSVDRYANLEVNYLLQRMEHFDGITILTTNLESSVDAAFKRRLSCRIEFPFPEPDERTLLWQSMLPSETLVDGGLAFHELAQRFEMAGGHIRNAVLRAAFLAAQDGGGVTMGHMLRAAELEYQSMGKVMAASSPQ